MVPIPLTFVTFYKTLSSFLFAAHGFYSVKPINNKTGMENKTYLEVSDDDLLAQGITFWEVPSRTGHWESKYLIGQRK